MALMAMIGIGALSYVVMTRGRSTSQQDVRIISERDMNQAVMSIGTLLLTPSHCNANFFSKPTSGSLTGIYKCSTGSCQGTGGVLAIPVANPAQNTNLDWKDTVTGLTSHVRIIAITYNISATEPQSMAPQKAARLDVKITFQRNMGTQTKFVGSTATADIATRVELVKTFQAFVRTHNWSHPDPNPANPGLLTAHPSNLIYGCTKSPNSTQVY